MIRETGYNPSSMPGRDKSSQLEASLSKEARETLSQEQAENAGTGL
jgi:hypothetical protein